MFIYLFFKKFLFQRWKLIERKNLSVNELQKNKKQKKKTLVKNEVEKKNKIEVNFIFILILCK